MNTCPKEIDEQIKQKLKIIVFGNAVPKQSFKIGKYGAYQPNKVTNYSNLIKFVFKKEYPKHNPKIFDNKAIKLIIKEYRSIPTSKSNKFKNMALMGKERPITKPDVDNILKQVNDSLNGIAYTDDRQIATEIVEKWYSDIPRIEIEIIEI